MSGGARRSSTTNIEQWLNRRANLKEELGVLESLRRRPPGPWEALPEPYPEMSGTDVLVTQRLVGVPLTQGDGRHLGRGQCWRGQSWVAGRRPCSCGPGGADHSAVRPRPGRQGAAGFRPTSWRPILCRYPAGGSRTSTTATSSTCRRQPP